MPFGGSCEYKDFGACVGAVKRSKKLSDERARAYCGELMRRTEGHCARQAKRKSEGVKASMLQSQELDQIVAELDREFGVPRED